jgi:hypothetical protein
MPIRPLTDSQRGKRTSALNAPMAKRCLEPVRVAITKRRKMPKMAQCRAFPCRNGLLFIKSHMSPCPMPHRPAIRGTNEWEDGCTRSWSQRMLEATFLPPRCQSNLELTVRSPSAMIAASRYYPCRGENRMLRRRFSLRRRLAHIHYSVTEVTRLR